MKAVRGAGFHPLAPPLREGTTYVLRATDFRGILMRVVVDARTGTIRDVNRIVPGPGSYGQIGDEPPPYGMRQPFGPVDYDAPMVPPTDIGASLAAPQPPHTASQPPLPRPRPATLVVGKSTDDANLPAKDLPLAEPTNATNAGANPNGAGTAPTGASPGASPGTTSAINTEVMTAAPPPPAVATAPKKTKPAVVPLND